MFLCFQPAGIVVAQVGFTRHTVDQVFEGSHAVQAADLDSDGDLDLMSATLNAIIWWKDMDGTQSIWQADTVSNTFDGARFVDAADIDGDGDLDIFGVAKSLDAVMWWENATGAADRWEEHVIDSAFDFAIHAFSVDLDNDGDLDVLGAALKDNAIAWWENESGKGDVWVKHMIDDAFAGARHVCVVDIDSDDDLDIVGSADLANTIAWWENTGGDLQNWVKHMVDDDFNGINSVFPTDFDGDGAPDLLGVADNADEIAWWKNIPGDSITWVKYPVAVNFDGAVSASAADLDRDGDMDVIGAAALEDRVNWWENTSGDGISWKEHIIDDAFPIPSFVTAVDLDNDGDSDVLGGNLMTNALEKGDIVWWENETQLPVELVSFNAVVNGNTVRLEWVTESELNNAGFEVQHARLPSDEKSLDWQAMGFVEGTGTTFYKKSYTYQVYDLSPGRHAFRLKQVDFDGVFVYSPVARANLLQGAKHEMTNPYPNPFNPQTRFSLTLASSQAVSIQVYNSIGQRVALLHDGELQAHSGHEFNFEANDLPGGLYVIRAEGENFTMTRRALLVK